MIQDMARSFARDVLAPGAAARDKSKQIEPEILAQMGELGFLGMTVPEELGGVGADYVSYALALMEVAAGDGAISTVMSVHNAPFNAILQRYGSPEQQQNVLRPACEGAFIGAFALTEPHAGSDASAIRSRARRDGDDLCDQWRKGLHHFGGRLVNGLLSLPVWKGLRGKKGITAFLVETSNPGYHVTSVEEKLGQRCSDTCALRFEEMRVSANMRIGEEGEGYKIALSSLETGRIGIAAQSVGMAQAALEAAVDYAKDRQSFGQPLIQHQAVGFRLAEARTQLEAARQLVLNAARMKDAGHPLPARGSDGETLCVRGGGEDHL